MAWDPTQIANLVLWVPSFNTSALWKEDNAAVARLTHATIDTDAVGQVDDPSPSAHRLYADSTATGPVLGSSGSRLSYLTFASASSQRITVENSLSALNFIHQGGAVSICVWVLCATDSTDMVIMDSGAWAGLAGFYLYRTSGNKVSVAVSKGGSNMVNFTSAASLTISSGWTPITVTWTGASSTGTLRVGAAGSDENVTVGTAGTGNANSNLCIGARTAHSTPWNGSLSDVVISNSVMSGTDLTGFRAYNPARDGVTLAAASAATATLTASQLNFLHSWYDFSDASTLWQDTALSTAVSANSDPIRTAVNKSSTLALTRNAVASGTTVRPLYKTAIQNGRACALWDGVDDDMVFESTWPQGGAWTAFAVCKMTNSAVAAHLLVSGSNNYWAVSGSAYGPPSTSVVIVHTGDGYSIFSPLVNADDWNILEFVRSGPFIRIWCNGVEGAPLTSVSTMAPTKIGSDPGGGASLWVGYLAELIAYRTVHSEANRSKLRAGLAAKWGVGNVQTTNVGGASRGRSRVGG